MKGRAIKPQVLDMLAGLVDERLENLEDNLSNISGSISLTPAQAKLADNLDQRIQLANDNYQSLEINDCDDRDLAFKQWAESVQGSLNQMNELIRSIKRL